MKTFKQVITEDEDNKLYFEDLRDIVSKPHRFRNAFEVWNKDDEYFRGQLGYGTYHRITHAHWPTDSEERTPEEEKEYMGDFNQLSKHLKKHNIKHELSKDEEDWPTIYVPVNQEE